MSGNQLKMDLNALDGALFDLIRAEIHFKNDARDDTSPGGHAATASASVEAADLAALDAFIRKLSAGL